MAAKKKTKTKKAKIVKKGEEKGIINPVVPQFGKQNQFRGKEEINPKSTFNPVKERSGVRGDR